MPAPSKLHDLIDNFARHIQTHRSANYNETQVRTDFLNPLFEMLGWDMSNKEGIDEAFRDVILEDKIKVQGKTKAPDFCFRVGGERKFFLEAKRPSVNIKEDTDPAYQIRRYAWSAKLPVSILSDFEEFAIYDCRAMPHRHDLATVSRMKFFRFEDLPEHWDFLESHFSRDAVASGSLEVYAESMKLKRGSLPVDDAFLAEIEDWRDSLARTIALRNADLTQEELNFAVQRTIDRIIFLRICEDRGIEEYELLKSLCKNEDIYSGLVKLFHQADARFNSGLFHFRKEKGETEGPDNLTPDLKIDDKALKQILGRLYYPESPYEFSVLPASILGQVYERFLGKVIRLTAGHRAKVEEKPEVRKAGGVYYTPDYISEYIVANTVGKKLEGLTPKEAASLRILDPACGSGSFLLAAYDYLLNWHLGWYVSNNPEAWAKGKNPPIYRASANEPAFDSEGEAVEQRGWKLTTATKKQILLDNIYGVDIDRQAVEVTKLSLLLRVLEGENGETLGTQMKLIQDRVLPDLGGNIKCGNSLIGSDFYDGEGNAGLNIEERRRVNAFDWELEFGEVMKKEGGFDVIIGNPPYVRSQNLELRTKEYVVQTYSTASYQPDLFAFFIEKGILLLKKGGRLGFIVPSSLLTNTYYQKLRKFLLDETRVETLIDLKSGVFDGASVDTVIVIVGKDSHTPREAILSAIGVSLDRSRNELCAPVGSVIQSEFFGIPDFAFNTNANTLTNEIVQKIISRGSELGERFEIKAGMKVRKEFVESSQKDSRYKKFLKGGDVKPFDIEWGGRWVCYDKDLEVEYSNQAFREEWIFEAPSKVLVRQVMGKNRIYATIDSESYYVDQSLYVLLPKSDELSVEYVLAMICSKLLCFYFENTMSDRKQTFPKIKGSQIGQLPMPTKKELGSDFDRIHDLIKVKVVELLALMRDYRSERLEGARVVNQRESGRLERQIDELVYEAFKLSAADVAYVEGALVRSR